MKKIILACLYIFILQASAYAYELECQNPAQYDKEQCVKHVFDEHDGKFSAMLIPIHKDQLKEFSKPSNEHLNLTGVTKAQKGDQIVLMPLYTGIMIDADFNADVTYDIKIIAPNNEIYSGADLKNMVALKNRMVRGDSTSANPDSTFHAQDYMIMRFEPKDLLGVYNIYAEIRDNIGKRTVKLHTQIELTE